jgi:hypothetical protein
MFKTTDGWGRLQDGDQAHHHVKKAITTRGGADQAAMIKVSIAATWLLCGGFQRRKSCGGSK